MKEVTTDSIIQDINDKQYKKSDIAERYMALILCTATDIDWTKINRAIINRWSVSGLNRIKNLAWREIRRIMQENGIPDDMPL